MSQVTKGCIYNDGKTYNGDKPKLEVIVTVYNLGFYITTYVYRENRVIPEVNSTTRNSPLKVSEYINSFLINNHIALDDPNIEWKGYNRVVKDRNGFNQTKL